MKSHILGGAFIVFFTTCIGEASSHDRQPRSQKKHGYHTRQAPSQKRTGAVDSNNQTVGIAHIVSNTVKSSNQ